MKKYSLTHYTDEFAVYPLEVDGPNSLSTARQIISVDTGTNTIRLGGNLLHRFIVGFSFDVVQSADGTLDGTYTVATPPQLVIQSTHDVKTPVVVATTSNVGTLSGLLTIDGILLAGGDRVLLMGQTNPAHNGIYVAAVGAWGRATDFDSQVEINTSAVYVEQGSKYGETTWLTSTLAGFVLDTTPITFVQHIGNVYTEFTTTQPIATPTGSLGAIVYTLPGHTSLQLPGNGAFDVGQAINQNWVSLTDNFADAASPLNPIIGQLWYNTASETLQRYVDSYGPGWTADIDMDTYKIVFRDPENANTDIWLTAADGEPGLSVRPVVNPTAGQSIFRVLSGTSERLDVQYDGYVASTNSLLITGTTLDNVFRGKVIVSPSKTTTTYSLDVDGNVNIDTGDIQLDNTYGIVSGAAKSIKSDALGTTWNITGSVAVNTNDLFINEANGRVGINTVTPTVGFDVNTDAHVTGTTDIDGATTINNTLTVDMTTIINPTGNTLYVDTTNGRVGVNTIPTTAFDVNGAAHVSGITTLDNNLVVDTNVLFVNVTTNRVGINEASPLAALHVTGDAIVTGSLGVDGTTLVVSAINDRVGINKAIPTVPLDVVGDTTITGITSLVGDVNITTGDLTVDTDVLVVDTTGNFVGINKAVPVVPLDVVGDTTITGDMIVTGDFTWTGTDFTVNGATTLNGIVTITDDVIVETDAFVVDTSNKYVGIGTATPAAPLHVVGETRLIGPLLVDGDVLVVDNTNNRVGINTATPTVPLDVVGDALITGDTTVTGMLTLDGNLAIDTDVLVVDTTGNFVGINKAVPVVPLDVVGDGAFTGNIGIGTTASATDALTVNGDIALTSTAPVIKFPDADFAVGEGAATIANQDVLLYNTTNSRWENTPVADVVRVKAAAHVTGTTGAIVNDFGITSVTHTGTGTYTVTMDTTYASANDYVVNVSIVSASPAHISYSGKTTNTFNVSTFNATSNIAADFDFSFIVTRIS